MTQRKLWSQRSPLLFLVSVWVKRLRRMARWRFDHRFYARERRAENLPFSIKEHRLPLVRNLTGVDRQLQLNKVTNLRLAAACIDGVVIRPGEVFSFYRLVGWPHRMRGFLPGLELAGGKARSGTGGGLCQIANLLHWLVLHSPLTISEHHHHSYDVFPDDDRIQPFGSGATLFYNYLDYQFTNGTAHVFQLRLVVADAFLEGALLCDKAIPDNYEVFERNHAFLRRDGEFYRANELWRRRSSSAGEVLETTLVKKNFAKMMYEPEGVIDIPQGEGE